MPIKFLVLDGGRILGFGGVPIYFCGRGDFCDLDNVTIMVFGPSLAGAPPHNFRYGSHLIGGSIQKVLRVCGEFFQGLHGSCHPS